MKTDFRFDLGNYDVLHRFGLGFNAQLATGDDIQLRVTDIIGDPFETEDFVEALKDNPTKNVHLEINTPGGSVVEAARMFAAMVEHPGQITGQITGQAASAGMILACGCDRITANESSSVMVHPANISVLWADASLLEMALEMVNQGTEQIIDLMAIRTGMPRDEMESLVMAKNGQGTRLTAKKAYEMKMVDEVIPTPKRGTKAEVPASLRAQATVMARARAHAAARG